MNRDHDIQKHEGNVDGVHNPQTTDVPVDMPMMWLGLCQSCMTIQAIWPHPERSFAVPEPTDWEAWASDCKVCDDGTVDWDEHVPVTDYLKRGF
ncbi:hypothetical protein [Gordonia sputi]